MQCFNFKDNKSGFTLIELLIYAAIFSVSAVFLVNILTSITQTQIRQASANEVSQQVSFVSNTIQRLVREASIIENDSGVASSTIRIRTSASSTDPTLIYWDETANTVQLRQGANDPVQLTNEKVIVSSFSMTKYENPGGNAIVQVDLSLSANTTVERAKVTKFWRGAITRISAATFDSDLLPNTSNVLNLGGAGSTWKDGFFNGAVNIIGKLGVSTQPSDISGMASGIKVNGDVSFMASANGVILKSPGGTCFRVTVTNAGALSTASSTCP
ncbi:MAG: type II secretion system protein [Candidatus Paceibacterota bacterium]|jgi:prepilin-type N-terminal cleavage/methylation domain-containing protein